MSTLRRVHVIAAGLVQGVGFRAWTKSEALKHACVGWVRNLPDGRVEAVIEGASGKLEDFLVQLKVGPPGARVVGLEVKELASKSDEFSSFAILRG